MEVKMVNNSRIKTLFLAVLILGCGSTQGMKKLFSITGNIAKKTYDNASGYISSGTSSLVNATSSVVATTYQHFSGYTNETIGICKPIIFNPTTLIDQTPIIL